MTTISAHRLLLAAAVMSVGFGVRNASAQTSTEVALAETLYRQARELMTQNKFDEACPKLAESYRLDRATGTLLNLASCHERQGKVTTAWSEYTDAAVAARRDGRVDRVKFAEDRIKVLEPQLPKLTLGVAPGADQPDLEIRLDGGIIGAAARGVPTPVDPGKHTIEAKAPRKLPWSREIEVRAAEQQTVTVDKLVDAPAPPAAPVEPDGPRVVTPPSGAPTVDDVGRTRPVPASVYIMGTTTVALGIASAVTGALYLGGSSQFSRGEGNHSEDALRRLGYVNAGLFAATAVGAGVTAYLYFARPQARTAQRAPVLAPYAGADGGGVCVMGAF